jgi:hypothetical protein
VQGPQGKQAASCLPASLISAGLSLAAVHPATSWLAAPSATSQHARTPDRPPHALAQVRINFEISRYDDLIREMDSISLEELIMAVRRQSQGFSRGEQQPVRLG